MSKILKLELEKVKCDQNHAVPDSHYIRWGHRHERPSGSGRTAPLTADRTPRTEGPQSSPALASPSSTRYGGEEVEGIDKHRHLSQR